MSSIQWQVNLLPPKSQSHCGKAEWIRRPEVAGLDATIPDQPDFEIETRTEEPEDGVHVLVEWLESQNFSVNHVYNPKISAVAIHVDQS